MAYTATNQLRRYRLQIIDPDDLRSYVYETVFQQFWQGDPLLGEIDEWRIIPLVEEESRRAIDELIQAESI